MADETKTPRRIDPLTLIAGLATLAAAAFVLTDGRIWLPSLDPRWLLAGVAVLVGVLLLGGSLRGKRK
ncbi:hypothetical protein [Actinokineospora diospyrosa]|uniref:MYXO-CTERM domain-containing protein n=1 Tax=Actinokineospora diospyrosa TaxID=103728 RepID=A0ABT1IIH9_9PSEU|nr:hypothetical protein [Actinokineospora diospyrosa]MCP2272450.1 Protein of unknown function (DUF3995) [Actinokineospora diospyrosa]